MLSYKVVVHFTDYIRLTLAGDSTRGALDKLTPGMINNAERIVIKEYYCETQSYRQEIRQEIVVKMVS